LFQVAPISATTATGNQGFSTGSGLIKFQPLISPPRIFYVVLISVAKKIAREVQIEILDIANSNNPWHSELLVKFSGTKPGTNRRHPPGTIRADVKPSIFHQVQHHEPRKKYAAAAGSG
jgi:hypothetical protein